ncbi:hypothetical protein E1A91_D10G155100v1 [Gossypium mustelinum]|uniref:Uncharacterized protein n=1 Tax=Gossypium mustelinum TaxID=34275 RepID=A0A5D2T977_GOSMU|nr:hypothetical protein E1A91_D10G155100v1 [Gossypium mustelinum]
MFYFSPFFFPKSIPPIPRNLFFFFPHFIFPNHFSPTPILFILPPNFPKLATLYISSKSCSRRRSRTSRSSGTGLELAVWDKKMVHAQFNWYWYHVPTFAPYKVEGLFLPLILAHGSSKQSAKTVLIVLQSLTPNGQSVFRILAEYQLSHPNDEGMAIDNLYSISRERFLVSSQQHELPHKDGLRPSKNRKEKERQAMENSSSSSELQKLIEAIKISEVVKGRTELIAKLADLHLSEQFDVKSATCIAVAVYLFVKREKNILDNLETLL